MQKWEYLTVRCETVSGRTIPQRMNDRLLPNWKENPPYEVFFNQLGEQGPDKGLLFDCQNCHYRLHADLIGARQMTMRTLLVRQDWARTGTLSVSPDGSDREAKAARLRRYAELRWSPDPGSCREAWGN